MILLRWICLKKYETVIGVRCSLWRDIYDFKVFRMLVIFCYIFSLRVWFRLMFHITALRVCKRTQEYRNPEAGHQTGWLVRAGNS